MTAEPMMNIELLGVLTEELLHPFRKVLLRGLDQQVDVIVHQAVRVTDPAEAADDRVEQPEEALAVGVTEEDLLVSVASRRDVEDAAGGSQTMRSGHLAERMQGRVTFRSHA